jgi:DNA-binding transcriptional MerR regulator
MANDLLKQIKDLGYTHEQVLEILKKSQEPEGSEPVPPEPPAPAPPKEKPEGTPDVQTPPPAPEPPKEKPILTENIKQLVNEELQKQISKLRGTPPTGTESDTPSGHPPIIKKNLYEKWV